MRPPAWELAAWAEPTSSCGRDRVIPEQPSNRDQTSAALFSDVGGRVVLGTPKSHQSRTVPVPRFIAIELAGAADGKRPDDLIFTMPGGSVVRMSNWRRATFVPARARAGLSDRFRVHDLRHTAASLFPGRLPAQDAPGDHGPCQHHHDPRPVRASLPG